MHVQLIGMVFEMGCMWPYTRQAKTWKAIGRLLVIERSDLSNKIKGNFFQAAVVFILLYKCTTWTLTKWKERKPEGNCTRMLLLYFDLRPGPKILFQGNTPEGSDTFQRPVIERDRVGGLRLMIWDKVKVPLCHYSHAPEESNLWTAWQLFPLDDD